MIGKDPFYRSVSAQLLTAALAVGFFALFCIGKSLQNYFVLRPLASQIISNGTRADAKILRAYPGGKSGPYVDLEWSNSVGNWQSALNVPISRDAYKSLHVKQIVGVTPVSILYGGPVESPLVVLETDKNWAGFRHSAVGPLQPLVILAPMLFVLAAMSQMRRQSTSENQ